MFYKIFTVNAYGAFWKDKNRFDVGEYPKYYCFDLSPKVCSYLVDDDNDNGDEKSFRKPLCVKDCITHKEHGRFFE